MSTAPDAGTTGGTDEVPSTEVVFHRVARSGQVPEGYIRRFYVGDLECAVARLHGKVHATSNYCTHLDCLLSSGKIIDDGIRCSCHGSVFDLDSGEAIYPPATKPITTYSLAEVESKIFVKVTDEDVAVGEARRVELDEARRRAASS